MPLRIMRLMKTPALAHFACTVALGLAAAAASAQQPPAAPAAAASAPPPNPVLVLPQWAQNKLSAAKADPKVYEKAYKEGAKLATFCANCHGPAGQSVKPEVPNLAGQNTVFVLNQLNKFHDGRRKGAFFMEGLVRAMSNDELFAVTLYYTNQEPKPSPAADPALAARGKVVYENGCKKCHGDSGAGSERSSRIAGQQPEYLEHSIRRYRDNNVRADEKMFKYTKGLTDAEIKALVAYIGAMR
jgi:cytochrome c553